MKEEESAKQLGEIQEEKRVNPINNITRMIIKKIIYTYLRRRRWRLPSSKMRR